MTVVTVTATIETTPVPSSGAERPPPRDASSGTETPPCDASSGAEIPPCDASSEAKMSPRDASIGAEMSPCDASSGAEIPPCDASSGAEMPPCDASSGAEKSPCDASSGAEMPPCDASSGAEILPCDTSSGAEMPPCDASSEAEMPPCDAIKKDVAKEEKVSMDVIISIPECEDDAPEPEVYGAAFEDEEKRIAFMQKILAIKMLQAFSVTLVLGLFVFCQYPIYEALGYEPYTRIHLTVVSSLILAAVLGLLNCCSRKRFIAPYNYTFLVAYPLAFGCFISVITFGWGLVDIFVSWVQFNFILFTLLVNCVLALHTKTEFKPETALYMAAIIIIMSYACTAPIIEEVSAFGVLFCRMMVFVLTAYVVYDLEAMVSKTYWIHLTPADYIKASLIMHIDYRYIIKKFWQNVTSLELKSFQDHESLESNLNAAECTVLVK